MTGPPREDPAFEGPDLTPMIDVVFQLLIFLLVANDLVRRDIEDLLLPLAPHAAEDPAAPPGRLTVNVLPGPPGAASRFSVRGVHLDGEGLARTLREHAALAGEGASVLVRADRAEAWIHVEEVLRACGAPGAAISRFDVATSAPEGGTVPPGPRSPSKVR